MVLSEFGNHGTVHINKGGCANYEEYPWQIYYKGYKPSHCFLVLYIIKIKWKIERLFWNKFRRHSQIHQINYFILEVSLQGNPNTLIQFNLPV